MLLQSTTQQNALKIITFDGISQKYIRILHLCSLGRVRILLINILDHYSLI